MNVELPNTRDSQENPFQVESLSEVMRARFANSLEQFVQENASLKEAENAYQRFSLEVAQGALQRLREGKPIDAIRTIHAGKEMHTLVLQGNKEMDFLDMVGRAYAGYLGVSNKWEPDVPSIAGTYTVSGEFEGQGLNSHRIRTAAKYLYDVRHQLLHSSIRFDDERAKQTWEGMLREGRAKWVANQARYQYIPESSV